jgi:acetyl-CoA carboxylase biotin carboxyl carrier protein
LLTFDQIKELLELVAARQLRGLELERAGFRLKIAGPGAPGAAAERPAAAPPAAAPSPTVAHPETVVPAPQPPAVSPPAESGTPSVPAGTHLLTSPIVGTFYRAASPDAEPFVEVGGRVRKGQVLCIIEAMKLMNEIESDVDGVVAEIYPQNAQAVEYGEPLFAIRTA